MPRHSKNIASKKVWVKVLIRAYNKKKPGHQPLPGFPKQK